MTSPTRTIMIVDDEENVLHALSRTLRPLEARRWVRSERGEDRRERSISLTMPGRAQLERARPAWERAQRRLKSRIGAERWDDLLRELATLAGVAREA